MLSQEENERFARVGPGTPMGNLLRRYWHPVGCTELVTMKPQRVKVLGEDLVLYRGASGKAALMQLRCAHRSLALDYGRVEGDSLRCPYHGWLYDRTGQCVAQPAEPEGSGYIEKIRLTAYPTKEVSGLIFAYMGPEPAPVLPLYHVLRMNQGVKQITVYRIGASWFNDVENILDKAHFSWLHGHTFPAYSGKKISYHFERTDYGISGEMRIDGIAGTKANPFFFPAINQFTLPPTKLDGTPMHSMVYRVPSDDTSHEVFFVGFVPSNEPLPSDQRVVRAWRRDVKFGEYKPHAKDWWGIDLIDQDRMALEQQGVVPDRTKEHLGVSDTGIILMRRMMREAMIAVERGEDPPGIIRDPAKQEVDLEVSMGVAAQNRQEDTDYSIFTPAPV